MSAQRAIAEPTANTLYFGDCPDVMREDIPDQSVGWDAAASTGVARRTRDPDLRRGAPPRGTPTPTTEGRMSTTAGRMNSGSLLQLTPLGEEVAGEINMDGWVKYLVGETLHLVGGMGPYELQEFCRSFVRNHVVGGPILVELR